MGSLLIRLSLLYDWWQNTKEYGFFTVIKISRIWVGLQINRNNLFVCVSFQHVSSGFKEGFDRAILNELLDLAIIINYYYY